MGDRANVFVRETRKEGVVGVYLYTHWAGRELAQTVYDALTRGRDRWDDGQYLTRIIFEEMIDEDRMGLTGYGISATMLKSRMTPQLRDAIVKDLTETADALFPAVLSS